MPKCLEKTCSICGQELPATKEYFYRNGSAAGLAPYCKTCHYQKTYENTCLRKRKNPERIVKDNGYHDESELKGLEKGSDEYIHKWNQIHKITRSQDYEVRVEILKGTADRTVVI